MSMHSLDLGVTNSYEYNKIGLMHKKKFTYAYTIDIYFFN